MGRWPNPIKPEYPALADDRDAECFGKIRAELKRRGELIGPYDMLIAAQAVARNMILVTNNTAEFARVPELVIEDWK